MGGDQPARAACAQLRLGDLRRRRLDPRAHPRDGQAHPGRDQADAGRASDLRRARARAEIDAVIRGYAAGRHPPYRGAARRSARRRRRRYAPHPGGYQQRRRSGRRHQSASPTSKSRSRPIRKCIPTARRRRRYRHAQGQGRRRRRRAPSPSSSSRTRLYFRFLDRVRGGGIDYSDRAGHHAGAEFQARPKIFAARAGASVPDWLAERFDGLDDDPATRS